MHFAFGIFQPRALQNIVFASQSLRPQTQINTNHFSGGVYVGKILIAERACKRSECAERSALLLRQKARFLPEALASGRQYGEVHIVKALAFPVVM